METSLAQGEHTRWHAVRARCPDWLWDTGLALLALLLLPVELRPIEDFGGYLETDAIAVSLYTVLFAALLARRRVPLAAALVVLATSYVYQSLGYVTLATIELVTLVALFSAAAHGRPVPRSAALGVIAVWLLAVNLAAPIGLGVSGFVIMYVICAGAWMLGERDRTHRAYEAMLLERQALLLRQHELEAAHAAASERTRIARELHDVIAHGLGVVVVQAEAALYDPDLTATARGPLDAIRTSARASLTEARRVLGMLRGHDEAARAPQPGIADLERLAAEFTAAGLEVSLTLPPDVAAHDPPALDPGLDLSIYRIVEEALSNTLRHAGPTRARVTLEVTSTALHLEVIDDGRGTSAPATEASTTTGHGLIGMRERVTMLHGTLEVGPLPGGGFAVRASLPLATEAPLPSIESPTEAPVAPLEVRA